MSLPSFRASWSDEGNRIPRIAALKLRHPERVDSEPTAWLLVEREEHYERGDSGLVDRASIRLTYKAFTTAESASVRGAHSFDASFCRDRDAVRLSAGAIFVDPGELRGHRIGTFLMHEVVKWAKQWPDAVVSTVELLEGQAYADNKHRRNRFYERFGLRFEFTDEEQRAGRSLPMRVRELKEVDSWRQNIEVCDPLAFVAHTLERAEAAELEAELAKGRLRAFLADAKRESVPTSTRSRGRSWGLLVAAIAVLVLWFVAR